MGWGEPHRPVVREHLADEEPDVDELEQDWAVYSEMVAGTCERCGHGGHDGKECPTIVPHLLRPDT